MLNCTVAVRHLKFLVSALLKRGFLLVRTLGFMGFKRNERLHLSGVGGCFRYTRGINCTVAVRHPNF
jgi:hypothetical protein